MKINLNTIVIPSVARNLLFLLALVFMSTSPSLAQFHVATGTPPFGSFGGGPDVVNLGNNNVHLAVPVLHKAGRGQNFVMDITFDSSIWYPATVNGTPSWSFLSNFGWSGISNNAGGYINMQEIFIYAPCNPPNDLTPNSMSIYTNWAYMEQSGTAHTFLGAIPGSLNPRNGCSSLIPPPPTMTAVATDGSGITLSNTSGPMTVYMKDGTVVNVPINPAGSPQNWSKADRNGNQLNGTISGQFFDTLNATNPTLTQNLVYTAPSGATAQFVGQYATFTLRTNFSCGGMTDFGTNGTFTQSLLTEIDLPDYNSSTNPNSRYLIGYETTPGDTHSPHHVTGRVASITLPTGGTITYSYSGGSGGIVCSDGTAATLTRTVNDGTNTSTWTYARTQVSGNHWQTTITDPANNQTVLDFQKDSNTGTYSVPASYNFFETNRLAYQGSVSPSNLLQTTYSCYNGAALPCTTTSVATPIAQKSVITILPGARNLQSKATTFYDSHGNLTEADEYDFGSGAPPSTPTRKTVTAYASLTNNIVNMPSSVIVEDGSNNVKAKTTYAYDESAVAATSGTPQHNPVTGSRGNATTIKRYKDATNFLTTAVTYFDTGNVKTSVDVNGQTTAYNYADSTSTCGNSFPTSITQAVSTLSTSATWNCTGAVQLTVVNENGKTTTTAYNDPYFWRPASVTDPASVVASTTYTSPTSLESTLSINANSVIDSVSSVDGLGRSRLSQVRQAPGSSNFDTQQQDYDILGRASRSTVAFNGTLGQTSSTANAVTTTYDALGRPLTVTDAGGGTVSYSYSQNDVLVTIGPAPTGESTKRRQLEYDGYGRLTSVCELTTATGSGTCGQSNSQTGFWTKYTYDLNNNLIGVTQNAQAAAGSQQTRSYVYDFLSRLTSETNPESGTTTYTYDSASGCTGTYNGDLVKKVDAVGNTTCFTYDALHRKLSVTYPSGTYASVTPSKFFVYDSATVNGATMTNAKGRLAEAYTCTTCPGTKLTDIGYSYSNREEISDVYESTPHSGGYYHLTQSYWAHGAPNVLSGIPGLPTITYGGTIGSTVGLDGEGRITQITASTGANPVTGVTYSPYATPPQTTVIFGSGDSDNFQFDPQTGRATQYKFNVGTTQSMTGALTWNANSTLKQLAITDPFNSGDTQTCNYGYDDLTRLTSANCGTPWSGTYTFDPFGNLAKSGSMNFAASYSNSTNRMTLVGTLTPTYDANGNVLSDGAHTYSWDADGNSITVDGVGVTYDATDRAVEQNRSGSYTQIVYGPGGDKLALMNAQSLVKAFVPLSGGATAVYTSAGLDHYRHSDWLGSNRLSSTPSRTVQWSGAYAPWGEVYASYPSASADPSFTGQNSDTSTTGEYDFLYRQYGTQGRWPTPDPSGLAAVNPSNPQSWNRYAYVANNPLAHVDASGLCMANESDSGWVSGYDGPETNGYVLCGPDPDPGLPPDLSWTGISGLAGAQANGPDTAPQQPWHGYCPSQYQRCVFFADGSSIGLVGSSNGYYFTRTWISGENGDLGHWGWSTAEIYNYHISDPPPDWSAALGKAGDMAWPFTKAVNCGAEGAGSYLTPLIKPAKFVGLDLSKLQPKHPGLSGLAPSTGFIGFLANQAGKSAKSFPALGPILKGVAKVGGKVLLVYSAADASAIALQCYADPNGGVQQ